jgi:hypothetical protein
LRNLFITLLLVVAATAQTSSPASQTSVAQQVAVNAFSATQLAAQVPAPRKADVATMDGTLHAIYDCISGPAGERDWNRFRSLFVPQVRFTQTGKKPDGSVFFNPMSEEEFIRLATDVFKSAPFYENGIVNNVQTYGNIAQVFSSYESRRAPGEKPFDRGINSVQLLNDGTRWWVVSIFWDDERPDNPLPAEFSVKK